MATRVLTICAVFEALILTAVYGAKEHTALFRMLQASGTGGLPGGAADIAGVKAARLIGLAELGPGDPTVRFSDTRVGHVLFASARSDNCWRLLFDNRTGAYYQAKEIFCGQRVDQVIEAEGPARLTALRKSFQR